MIGFWCFRCRCLGVCVCGCVGLFCVWVVFRLVCCLCFVVCVVWLFRVVCRLGLLLVWWFFVWVCLGIGFFIICCWCCFLIDSKVLLSFDEMKKMWIANLNRILVESGRDLWHLTPS